MPRQRQMGKNPRIQRKRNIDNIANKETKFHLIQITQRKQRKKRKLVDGLIQLGNGVEPNFETQRNGEIETTRKQQ